MTRSDEASHSAYTRNNNAQFITGTEWPSAWTLPERVRYAVIRQRRDARADSPYVPEAARILVAATTACTEIIGTGKNPPGADGLRTMADWYRSHFDPNIKMAIDAQDRPRRKGDAMRR